MKLLMIESDAKGIWYFTGKQECADFLGVSYNAITLWLKGLNKTCRGFKAIEQNESGDVLSRYIKKKKKKYIELYGSK